MTTSLRTQLRMLLGCYSAGAKKPVLLTTGTSGTSINTHYSSTIRAHLSQDEQEAVFQSSRLCGKGLSAARKGDLALAEQCFAEVHALLNARTWSDEGLLHCKALYEKGVAYLDYVRRDFDQAEARTYESLALDCTLEEEYDCAILHLDRVQLVYNIMRIDIKRRAIGKALTLGFHLLNYLEKKEQTLPVTTSWDASRLSSLPTELVDFMFASIVTEMAFVLAGQETVRDGEETLSTLDIFASVAYHAQSDSEDCRNLSEQAHSWLQAKQALGEERFNDFFDIAAQALLAGPQVYPKLWYATLIDLMGIGDRLDLAEIGSLRPQVVKGMKHWEQFGRMPERWKQVLASKH